MRLSTKTQKTENELLNDTNDKYFALLLRRNRSRTWITVLTIILFIGIVTGVVYALMFQAVISNAWKEILLLLLGAFIGAYGRVMDFWFNNSETDIELMRQANGGYTSYYTPSHSTPSRSLPPTPSTTPTPHTQKVIVNCKDCSNETT